MRKLSLVVCHFVLLCVACNPTSETAEKPVPDESATQLAGIDNEKAIQLNEGKKWKVDPAMMVHIHNMETGVQAYYKNKNVQALSDNIQTDIKNLISSCKMTGQAHDELHKWLLPFIANADSLKSNAKTNTVEELDKALHSFHNYFE